MDQYTQVVQCRKCIVTGRVQGVYYRGSTQKQALALGVQGSARNLPDGRVEVIMCGQPDDLESLCNWLWQGPQFAEVNDVSCEAFTPSTLPDGFATL